MHAACTWTSTGRTADPGLQAALLYHINFFESTEAVLNWVKYPLSRCLVVYHACCKLQTLHSHSRLHCLPIPNFQQLVGNTAREIKLDTRCSYLLPASPSKGSGQQARVELIVPMEAHAGRVCLPHKRNQSSESCNHSRLHWSSQETREYLQAATAL